MKELIGNAVVGQSGGPTAVINASLAGVIKTVKDRQSQIPTLFGMKNGIEGLLKGDLVDLIKTVDTGEKLDLLTHTPGSFLGSCRKKLPDVDSEPDFYKQVFEIFRKFGIRYFFYIGGNDSMDTVAKISSYAKKIDYEIRIVGIPKTIDNDLIGTDHTPGFGSAAKYIAVTMQEIIRDCAVYTVPAVTVVEIMGRDSGWLTTASAIGRIVTGQEPDLVYLPERAFDMEAFFSDVRACLEKHPNVVVAVSEGIRFADGRYVSAGTGTERADTFGHAALSGTGKVLELAVKNEIGCKVRSIELNLPQRCSAHLASGTDLEEAFSVGSFSVEAACNGESGKMAVFVRAQKEDYEIGIEMCDVSTIANKVRAVDDRFINGKGNGVTDELCRYLLPLIRGEAVPAYRDGLPEFLTL